MYSIFDRAILMAVERARKDAEASLIITPGQQPGSELEKLLNYNFSILNTFSENKNDYSGHLIIQGVKIQNVQEKPAKTSTRLNNKTLLGGLLVGLGAPILRKRFVMRGAAEGTSIASKYLAKALPMRMPFRLMSTNVLGRAIGRAVPYVGWALLIIDVVELLVEEFTPPDPKPGAFQGFGGGSCGGGGARGSW